MRCRCDDRCEKCVRVVNCDAYLINAASLPEEARENEASLLRNRA